MAFQYQPIQTRRYFEPPLIDRIWAIPCPATVHCYPELSNEAPTSRGEALFWVRLTRYISLTCKVQKLVQAQTGISSFLIVYKLKAHKVSGKLI